MARIGFMASDEMSFENVDEGRTTTDACLYYSSGELKTALYLNLLYQTVRNISFSKIKKASIEKIIVLK